MLFATFLGMELALYVTWCNAGVDRIIGVNGRYFLPFVPFFIFILSWLASWPVRLPVVSQLDRVPAWVFCVPTVGMAMLNVHFLPMFIFRAFQMPGP